MAKTDMTAKELYDTFRKQAWNAAQDARKELQDGQARNSVLIGYIYEATKCLLFAIMELDHRIEAVENAKEA